MNTAAGGNFEQRANVVFGTALATGPLGSAVVFIVALLAILASLAQVIAMVARNGVLIVTAAVTPIAGAAAIYKGNEDFWRKLWMWQLAFVLYKPVAALIYATAFVVVGDGTSATDQLSGVALMIMSVVALPALLRLMMPVSAKMGGGGGGGLLGGAAVAASGVAAVTAARGRGPSSSGQSAPPSPSPGPSGATSTTATGAASASRGAGAAAAAGPVGVAAVAGLQLAAAAKQSVDRAAASGTGE